MVFLPRFPLRDAIRPRCLSDLSREKRIGDQPSDQPISPGSDAWACSFGKS